MTKSTTNKNLIKKIKLKSFCTAKENTQKRKNQKDKPTMNLSPKHIKSSCSAIKK